MGKISKANARQMLIDSFTARVPLDWDIIKDNAEAFVDASDGLRYEGYGGRDFWRFVCGDLRINIEELGAYLNAGRGEPSIQQPVNYDHPSMSAYMRKRRTGEIK